MTRPAASHRAILLTAFGAALATTAVVLDAEPLYVPAVAFLILGLGSLLWVQTGSRGLAVERMIVASTVQEGQPLAVRLTVAATRFVLPAGVIEEPLLESPAPLAAGRRNTSVHLTASFPRRGRRRLPPTAVLVRDPFALAARRVHAEADDEVLVLPAISEVRVLAGGQDGGMLGTGPAREGVAAETELNGLRPLRPGAPASRISWAAYARSGELLERRLKPEADSRPVVVLDPRMAPGSGPEGLDAAVRATASLCVHLARRGGCALLLPGERRPITVDEGLSGWAHLHARLAVLDGGPAPSSAALTGRSGAVIYVAARTLARAPQALEQARGAGRILVVPGAFAGRPAAFTVAGCTGYDLTARAAARKAAS